MIFLLTRQEQLTVSVICHSAGRWHRRPGGSPCGIAVNHPARQQAKRFIKNSTIRPDRRSGRRWSAECVRQGDLRRAAADFEVVAIAFWRRADTGSRSLPAESTPSSASAAMPISKISQIVIRQHRWPGPRCSRQLTGAALPVTQIVQRLPATGVTVFIRG